jgi:hypothetical protein
MVKITKEEVKSIAKEMIGYLRSDMGYNHTYDPIVYFAESDRYKTCSGGLRNDNRPFIFIAKEHFCVKGTHLEYDHIQDDGIIGGFNNGSVDKCIRAIVAHELAHVLEFTIKRVKYKSTFKGYLGGTQADMVHHGLKWQYFYSVLRERFVNHLS